MRPGTETLAYDSGCRDDALLGYILADHYAGCGFFITSSFQYTCAPTGISSWLASLFARVSTQGTYPLLVALYSALLGVFVPSGGSKWVIEAPYVLQAANLQHVHLGWVVQVYNAAEALPNLINPFWMLPLLGLLRLKARDLVGYGTLQLPVHILVVFFLCWFFARTIPYLPPLK